MSTHKEKHKRISFECITSTKFKNTPLSKFKSKKTGLHLAFADIEGPLVNCYIVVATKANDNHDGCPHVLEHMVFLGSEDYPYKGILDLIANRNFAQGTNAWTDVDHTCYTLTTAGSEGLLNILPVYMDHILFPTLTEEGFLTEVHHINGVDAGVVYCEMSGCENVGPTKTYHTMKETVFEGTPYGYNTGGRVEEIRKLNLETVRNFHKRYYRPDNICIIITGKVNPEDVFERLEPIEEKILKKLPNLEKMERPWVNVQVPKLEKNITKEILFPSNDDDAGAIEYLAWKTDIHWSNFLERTALFVMWRYLTESSVSPLYKVFIERDDPYCGNLNFHIFETTTIATYISFGNVKKDKIYSINDKFFETIRSICEEGVDMERMKLTLKRRKVKDKLGYEEGPHSFFSFTFISDFLYATDIQQLDDAVNEIPRLEELEKRSGEYWVDLLKKYFLNAPHVHIIGKPSVKYGIELAKAEEERLNKQREELGEEKLAFLTKQVEEAIKKNSIPPPPELLQKFPVPDVSKIPFINISTYRNVDQQLSKEAMKIKSYLDSDCKKEFPFYIQFDQIKSDFTEITAYIDTNDLPEELKYFIEIYLEMLFDTPIKLEDGTIIPVEEVVNKLSDEVVSKGCGIGLSGGNFTCGSFSQVMWISLKVENDLYGKAVEWLHNIIWNSHFTAEKMKISAQKLINDVARVKTRSRFIASNALKYKNFDKKKSNHCVTNMQRQYKFLTNMVNQLDDDPQSVFNEFNNFISHLMDPSKMRIHVICDVFQQEHPKLPFIEKFLPKTYNGIYLPKPVTFANKLLSQDALSNGNSKLGILFGLASTETSHLHQSCLGINDFKHEDRAALLVAIQYFTACEGPFWQTIRGMGLAYNYSMHMSIEEGLLYFSLSESKGVVKAYRKAKNIIEKYMKQEEEFDEEMVEAAKSGIIYDIICSEESMHMAAEQKFRLLSLQGVDRNYNKILLNRVNKTTKEDMLKVLKKYIWKLFDEKYSNVSICGNISKVKGIQEKFAKERELKIFEIEEYFK